MCTCSVYLILHARVYPLANFFDGKHMAEVRCEVCSEFREQSISFRNYCPKFMIM